jgi:manganese transport protein
MNSQAMSYDRSSVASVNSLNEVHASVATSQMDGWRRMFAFAGPAYLISVGYMDPGNWVTDLIGGAQFGYRLLWVIVMSNLMALLLQTLSARLGIVTRRDLAQACRDEYPTGIAYTLWILCEIAIVACDLAEVIGAAIGLNLLFKIPLLIGVLVTAADTLLILWFTRYGIRVIEAFVIVLILTISGCFAFEIFLSHPSPGEVLRGLVPHLNAGSLYIAVSILGATVMPHNLYLHSALVQTRRIGKTEADLRTACRYNFFDSALALNGAMFVNLAILVVAAATFFKHHIAVTELRQAHTLLAPLLGTTAASILFGAALLCSGQSSTLTGTMAGQVVMEGFLRFKMQPWLRRSVTRVLAIIPAVLTLVYAGEKGINNLIILSQVVLSLQLSFAVIPLVHLTSDRRRMGVFVNAWWVSALAWLTAAIILSLNIFLAAQTIGDWIAASGSWKPLVVTLLTIAAAGLLFLVVTVVIWPWIGHGRIGQKGTAPESSGKEPQAGPVAVSVPVPTAALRVPPRYSTILVPLDHSAADAEAVAHAVALAQSNGAQIALLHIEEGVTSRMYGSLASTAEIKEGEDYFDQVAQSLRAMGITTEIHVRHSSKPAQEIVRTAHDVHADLLIMAAHGHRGLKDIIFGTTINKVRHEVKIPILVVRAVTP